ncbi:MAG TPA: MFS transporter [Ktedonobacteraceae bacterium]
MSGRSADDVSPLRASSDFWKFWAGQTISNLGNSVSFFLFPLLIFTLTGSAINLALISAISYLPFLLFGLVIGAWVDRVDRKRLMVVVDALQMLLMLSLPMLSMLDHLAIWWVYVVAFLSSTLAIAFDSAQFAAIPCLVETENLVSANGRIQASYAAATVVGPLLAGVLLGTFAVASLFLMDALSFLVSVCSLLLIRTSFNEPASVQAPAGEEQPAPAGFGHAIVEGLRYVWGHPVLRAISLMMALVNFVGNTVLAQLVLFARQQFDASDLQISWLFAAGSVGTIALSLAAGLLRKRWSFSSIVLGSLALYGTMVFILALVRLYYVGMVLWALIAGLSILFNINTGSLRQAIVPNHLLGRVMAVASVLAWSAIPLGTLLGGVAIALFKSVAPVYAAIGLLILGIAVLFAFTALGRADRYLPASTAEDPAAPVSGGVS